MIYGSMDRRSGSRSKSRSKSIHDPSAVQYPVGTGWINKVEVTGQRSFRSREGSITSWKIKILNGNVNSVVLVAHQARQ